jgi:hypothetical protein
MEKSLLEKLPVMQPLKNFATVYEPRRLITVFTRAIQRSLSWDRSIQSIPSHLMSLISILILSTYLYVSLVVSFLLAFLPISYMQSFSPPFVLHILPISFSLTWSLYLYLVKSTSYGAPNYVVLIKNNSVTKRCFEIIHVYSYRFKI